MQLTGKEVNRNNRISLGVTIFSFMVLLLFLVFKNIMTPKPSSVSNPPGLNISMDNGNPYDFNGDKKSAGILAGKQETNESKKSIAVSDQDINSFNSMASQLLAEYKANSGKVTNTNNTATEAEQAATTRGKNKGSIEKPDDSRMDFDLTKRQLITAPEFTNDTKEEGKVIVEIIVDQEGTVIEANPNGRGTTTSNTTLKARAKQMALGSKFNSAPAIEEQRGSITINFSFN